MICPHCEIDKPDEKFQRVRRGKTIYYDICRQCQRAANRTRRFIRGQRGNTYESRNIMLRSLGFSSYAEYLKSKLWKGIRTKVFIVKGTLCLLCGAPADVAHHNRYHRRDLLGQTLKYINPICNGCHEKIEFRGGVKVQPKEAARMYRHFRYNNIKSQ